MAEKPFSEKEIKEPKKDDVVGETQQLIDDKELELAKESSTAKILEGRLDQFKETLKDLHNHNGTNSEHVSVTDLIGFIETVTTAPTHTPRHFYEQFKIYYDDVDTPSTRRLYIYSNKAQEWSYIALTV
jgi:hypothetical protein